MQMIFRVSIYLHSFLEKVVLVSAYVHQYVQLFEKIFVLFRLTLGEVLGEGAFGVVLKADARGIGADKVAVKTVKGLFPLHCEKLNPNK